MGQKSKFKLILQGRIHYYEVLQRLNQTTVISAPSFSGKYVKGAHLTSKGLLFSSKTMNNISYSIKQSINKKIRMNA